jgi:hypothetical protein
MTEKRIRNDYDHTKWICPPFYLKELLPIKIAAIIIPGTLPRLAKFTVLIKHKAKFKNLLLPESREQDFFHRLVSYSPVLQEDDET